MMTKEAESAAESDVVLHPIYGAALPALNWIPAPRYLMRRSMVLRLMRDAPPSRILDIGCGAGALLLDLASMGHGGVGLDQSPQALALARKIHGPGAAFEIHESAKPEWDGAFDVVSAFEVLEHIEDDRAAAADWRRYLRPDGRLIVSVPAHPELWNAADEWAGHVRRYRRAELAATLSDAGFEVGRIDCYGYPVANVMERFRARAYGRQLAGKTVDGQGQVELTEESGADRRVESKFWPVFSRWPATMAMSAACAMQRLFLSGDMGNGYIALARPR
ncbi:MAG: methyltransferase domain-containing protein [Pseudomonadota bacterium]